MYQVGQAFHIPAVYHPIKTRKVPHNLHVGYVLGSCLFADCDCVAQSSPAGLLEDLLASVSMEGRKLWSKADEYYFRCIARMQRLWEVCEIDQSTENIATCLEDESYPSNPHLFSFIDLFPFTDLSTHA